MRIISGKYKGKQLQAPSGLPVRPTTDMAKEGLFNMLASRVDIEGCKALDLFAGTGNISFELLSRGAAELVIVDKHPGCVRFIEDTLKKLDAGEARVYKTDAIVALERVKNKFDLIFADPPYDYKNHREIVSKVFERGLLAPGGWMVIEHPKEVEFSDMPAWYETRKYGKVHFSFFTLQLKAI